MRISQNGSVFIIHNAIFIDISELPATDILASLIGMRIDFCLGLEYAINDQTVVGRNRIARTGNGCFKGTNPPEMISCASVASLVTVFLYRKH